MNTLIVGSTGLVGSRIVSTSSYKYIQMARSRPRWTYSSQFIEADAFSLSYAEWLKILKAVKATVFLAFPTNLDKLETEGDFFKAKIVEGFLSFSKAAAELSVPVLFFSSDAVLWGMPFSDRIPSTKASNFLNKYAELKCTCEEILLKFNPPSSYVIRCTPVGIHAFLADYGFLGGIINRSLKGEVVQGFDDVQFSPVSLQQVNRIIELWILKIANDEPEIFGSNKILHVASIDSLTKFEFLRPIIDYFGGRISPISIDRREFIAPRTKDQRLITGRIQSLGSYSIKSVMLDALELAKEEFKLDTGK